MTQYFKWGASEALNWLWVVPLAALLGWRAVRLRMAAAQRFCPNDAGGRLSLRPLGERLYLKTGLVVVALGLMVLGLARPQVGLHRERAQRKGADIMLVMDTSLSMMARDMEPNRLEAAKNAAINLTNRLPNDRFGLVVFAGQALLYCPITVDHDAVQMFVDSVQEGASPQPGTALDDAVRVAAQALAESESRHRAMVILSDGEDHVSDTLEVAEKAVRETAARIEVLGFGSPQGEPIPMSDQQGNVQGFKRDSDGKIVLSKLGEQELRKLADIGKGAYLRALDRGAVDELSARLEAMEGAQVGTYVYTDYGERFQWPLLLALILLALEAIIPEHRGQEGRGPRRVAGP